MNNTFEVELLVGLWESFNPINVCSESSQKQSDNFDEIVMTGV